MKRISRKVHRGVNSILEGHPKEETAVDSQETTETLAFTAKIKVSLLKRVRDAAFLRGETVQEFVQEAFEVYLRNIRLEESKLLPSSRPRRRGRPITISEELLEIIKRLLKANTDLGFLLRLESEELKALVACIRERVDQSGK